jgi:hypothetical protein
MMKRFVSACLVVVAAVTLSAQKVSLGDDDIAAALATGGKAKGKHQGLILRDSAQGFAAALGSSGGAQSSTGFWVEVFTPTTWLEQQASIAAKKYQIMTAPVAAELLEPVLRIIAHPDMPNTVNRKGLQGTASVEHVILRDEKKKVVIQPTWTEPFDEEASNAMGGKAAFTGLNAKFDVAAIKEIRGPKGDQEFFITVVGSTREEKDFKVKDKHFKELK